MALCPVLKSPCIKAECAWWYQTGKVNGCSIAVTPLKIDEANQRVDDIINRLDRAFGEISYKGERLLGNYTDEMVEITQEKNKLEKQGHE
jgi:hypothetical protein